MWAMLTGINFAERTNYTQLMIKDIFNFHIRFNLSEIFFLIDFNDNNAES
jgi:hypothetical protein